MGGEENHRIPSLRQQTAGRMPHSPMGILGKYPVKFIRGEKNQTQRQKDIGISQSIPQHKSQHYKSVQNAFHW